MVILISPAKTFKKGTSSNEKLLFPKTTNDIFNYLNSLSESELKKHLNISDNILANVKMYLNEYQNKPTTSAITTYYGVTFKALDYDSLDEISQRYIDENLIIMSAFYGLLKPNTGINRYRLDFLFKGDYDLKNAWKKLVNDFLVKFNEDRLIVNLASNEFFSLINKDIFNVIDIEFYELKNGKLKKGSSQLKKARGYMARFMAINNVKSIDGLKKFNLEGYQYKKDLSSSSKLVFIKEK